MSDQGQITVDPARVIASQSARIARLCEENSMLEALCNQQNDELMRLREELARSIAEAAETQTDSESDRPE